PIRPIARRSAAPATPVTSSETTSGITVIRIALIQRTPTGVIASAARSRRASPEAATAAPAPRAAPSAIRTRVLSFIPSSHHQVAAVDVEDRPGDITRRLGGGEADRVGHFPRGAEAGHRIGAGVALELL